MIGTSTINMRAALQAAQDYLSPDLNAPVELLCQIYNALQLVDWNDSPEQHFQDQLLCGGALTDKNRRTDGVSLGSDWIGDSLKRGYLVKAC